MRNHWRRDALMGEDRSRSRNSNLLANLALIRNALLALLADHHPNQSLPVLRELPFSPSPLPQTPLPLNSSKRKNLG